MNNIFIRGSYNGVYSPINSLEFVDKDGKPFTIDRDCTDFNVAQDGTFEEMWSSVYLWDGETGDYAFSPSIFEGASLVCAFPDEDNDGEVVAEGVIVSLDSRDHIFKLQDGKFVRERYDFQTDIEPSNHIVSPVQLSSDMDYVSLKDTETGWSVSVGVRGTVKLYFQGKEFSDFSSFPSELQKIIMETPARVDEFGGSCPWFEAFVFNPNDEIVSSTVLDDDIFGIGLDALKDLLLNILLKAMQKKEVVA